MSGLLAKAYVDIEPDLKPLEAGLEKGKQEISAFVRDAQGRLRDNRGRFVGIGREAGENFGKGFTGSLLRGVTGFGGLGGLLAGVGVGVGATELTRTLYDSATAAADLDEAVSKNKYTFGRSYGAVGKTVDDLADKFGLVKTESLDAAANFGLVAQAAGMTKEESAQLASEFTKLAADASSFFNVPMEDALRRLQSGLVGEAEPMRRFGVLLNEDAVKNEALRMGLVRSTSEMTEQAKVAARASLIIRGMATVTGDLERTQGSAANQVRKLQGEWKNFQADFGKGLTGPLVEAIKLAREFGQELSRATGGKEGETLGDFLGGTMGGMRGILAAGQQQRKAAMDALPAGTPEWVRTIVGRAGMQAGAIGHILNPSQELADKTAGVVSGLPTLNDLRARQQADAQKRLADAQAEQAKRAGAIARGMERQSARIGSAKGDFGAKERLFGGDPAFEVGKLVGKAFDRAGTALTGAAQMAAAQKQARDRQDEQERKAKRPRLDAGVTTLEGAKQLSQIAALTRDPQLSELKKLNDQTEDVKTFLSTLVKIAGRPAGPPVARGRE